MSRSTGARGRIEGRTARDAVEKKVKWIECKLAYDKCADPTHGHERKKKPEAKHQSPVVVGRTVADATARLAADDIVIDAKYTPFAREKHAVDVTALVTRFNLALNANATPDTVVVTPQIQPVLTERGVTLPQPGCVRQPVLDHVEERRPIEAIAGPAADVDPPSGGDSSGSSSDESSSSESDTDDDAAPLLGPPIVPVPPAPPRQLMEAPRARAPPPQIPVAPRIDPVAPTTTRYAMEFAHVELPQGTVLEHAMESDALLSNLSRRYNGASKVASWRTTLQVATWRQARAAIFPPGISVSKGIVWSTVKGQSTCERSYYTALKDIMFRVRKVIIDVVDHSNIRNVEIWTPSTVPTTNAFGVASTSSNTSYTVVDHLAQYGQTHMRGCLYSVPLTTYLLKHTNIKNRGVIQGDRVIVSALVRQVREAFNADANYADRVDVRPTHAVTLGRFHAADLEEVATNTIVHVVNLLVIRASRDLQAVASTPGVGQQPLERLKSPMGR